MRHDETGAAADGDAARKIRVFVVDDHPLLREGLRIRIQSQVDMAWAGEARSLQQAIELIGTETADVAIVDLTLAGGDGFSLIESLRSRVPSVELVVFSASAKVADVARSLELGARGYVCKQEDSSDILSAVRAVAAGKSFLGRDTARRFRRYRAGDGNRDNDIGRLSKREREIFELIAAGRSTGQIADELFLSPHTIGTHKDNIRHKLGATNSTELMQRAIEWKLGSD